MAASIYINNHHSKGENSINNFRRVSSENEKQSQKHRSSDADGFEVLSKPRIASQVITDNLIDSSMVSNEYVLTLSEDEAAEHSSAGDGIGLSNRQNLKENSSVRRRTNTVTTNKADIDEEPEVVIFKNFTDAAFDRYYRRKIWFLILIRACCLLSVVSVCMNTPITFKSYPSLRYVTFIIDTVTGLVLLCEAIIKILHKGFIKSKKAYLKSPGRVFEFVMVICIFASITLQGFELSMKLQDIIDKTNGSYLMISFVRAPRPLLLLRLMKSVLNLSLPKTVSYRSMKQIWGVLLFTVYFMMLAALIGVQMFGLMNSYCIKNDANPKNITASDLLIPVTRCKFNGTRDYTFKCPKNFKCRHLKFKKYFSDRRPFGHILLGLLTVYEASAMEGWSTVMYAALNTRHFIYGVFYFTALILFISLLVRNVFIAIITEAFADLRLQVSKSQQPTQQKEILDDVKILRKNDGLLCLEHQNEISRRSFTKQLLFKITHSMAFQVVVLLLVIADAIIQSFFPIAEYSKYLQIFFTMVFDIESILKIVALGWKNYFMSSQLLFEFILCVGSTVFLPCVVMVSKGFVIFQVLRPFRIVLLFSSIRSFLKRILGSGRKITNLIFFTLTVLIIAAGISLQLFCGTGLKKVEGAGEDYAFDTFPNSLKALFQIFMTEAWVEVMEDVLLRGGLGFAFLVYPVFILFHLLASTILISVFVALILDNLELNEEVKIAKQRRQGEEVADTQERLPARMRVYQKLKPQPKLTKIDYVEANLPKIRQSFVTSYVNKCDEMDDEIPLITQCTSIKHKNEKKPSDALRISNLENQPDLVKLTVRKQSSVSALVQESHNKRMTIHNSSTNGNVKQQRSISKSVRRGLTRNTSSYGSKSREESELASGFRLYSNKINFNAFGKRFNDRKRNLRNSGDRQRDADVRQKLEEAQRKKDMQIENIRENHPLFDKSLFIFSVNNPIRRFAHKIVHTRYEGYRTEEKGGHIGGFSKERIKRYLRSQTWLDWVMLFLTQISIIAMLFEKPDHRTFDDTSLKVIEYIFVISSTIELTLKIIADGLIFAPNGFIRDFGNVLHVFIYIISLIYICWEPQVNRNDIFAQWILVLRALRPLRLITLAPPLRKVVVVLVNGYKDIFKVAILQLALMFVFSSYGVQYLGNGQLKRCNDKTKKDEAECKGVCNISIADPNELPVLQHNIKVLVPCMWRNPRNFNFDNMAAAFLALLEVLSLEGWTEVRDIIQERFSLIGSIYPHAYVFCAGLIGLTLFIGVIVSNFNENKGTALLTVEQKRWKDLKKKIVLAQPLRLPTRPPEGTFRLQLYEIFIGKPYNIVYAFVIFINCGMLFPGQWEPTILKTEINYLLYTSIVCCVLFFVDTVLKIYAFHFGGYWLSLRNRFDLFLMVCGLIFCIWTIFDLSRNTDGWSKQFGVAVFVLRFVSLSGKHNGLRALMLTVIMSLIKSFFTISVLVCIILCYALVGVILFGTVKPGLAINRVVNFRTSYYALLLLLRVTTGEDWNKIMRDTMIEEPYCTNKLPENNCGNPRAALLYFHSYYLIVSYIFLNLFIAVVIENFSIFYSTDDDPIMSQQDIQCFQETWNQCDQDKSGLMSLARAKVVLRLLQGGLSLESMKQKKPLLFKCMCLELEKIKTGKNVTFHNVLFVLAYNKIDIAKSLQLEERLQREELENDIEEEVAAETIRAWVVRMVQKRRQEKRPKNKLHRQISRVSNISMNSLGSENDENDEMTASTLSLSHLPIADNNTLSPSSSFDVPETVIGLRNRKNEPPIQEDSNTEFYSWWNEEMKDK